MLNAPKNNALTKKEAMIFQQLIGLYQELLRSEKDKEAAEKWLKTRDIAEHCDMNIYQARYFLLNLETKGFVIHKTSQGKDRLYWSLQP